MFSKILCGTTLLAMFVLYVESTGHGGGSGPIIIKSGGGRHGRGNDLVMIGGQTKCGNGPTLIKTSNGRHRHRSSDLILIGGQNKCHEKKKVEHVPVPYPVKEYVPVPYKETVHVPVHVPMHIPVPMKKEEQSYGGHDMSGMDMSDFGGMSMDMGGYGGWRRR